MEGLKIQSADLSNGWVSITVEGEVDLATVSELQSAIDDVYANGAKPLVVDLTSTSFMDSTGLKALVLANRRFTEADREFAVAVSGGPVSRLIDLSGVDTSIKIVESPEYLAIQAG
jgi:anti-sigma B factor antagonist